MAIRWPCIAMHDVAVIGAGPAGAVAATTLARAGVSTLLIEQHRFPRDKVCGECLSALGIEVLERLGLAGVIAAKQPAILRQSILHMSAGRSMTLRLRRPMWGLSRRVMDLALLQAARAAGVRVLQPARCEAIEHGEGHQIRVRLLESNAVETIQCKFVILADGKAGLMPETPAPTDDLGIKAHFSDVNMPNDAIALFGVHGHYGGIAPIEDGLWNIAFSVPAAKVKAFGRNHDELFSALAAENAALAGCMDSAMRVSEWLASPLPRFGVMNEWPDGVIPIGNAAAALEPIGGEGMGLAMRSAELAADAVLVALAHKSAVNVNRLRRAYRKLWNVRRLACRAGAKIVSSPALGRLAVPLTACSDAPALLALRLIGK